MGSGEKKDKPDVQDVGQISSIFGLCKRLLPDPKMFFAYSSDRTLEFQKPTLERLNALTLFTIGNSQVHCFLPIQRQRVRKVKASIDTSSEDQERDLKSKVFI